MTVGDPTIIELSVEKTHVWLKDLGRELGDEDRVYAFRALRAVLHTLRDRLPVELAAALGAQLPTLIRGVYYEDWRPSRAPLPIHDVDAFLRHVAEQGRLAGETEASHAVGAVMRVVRAHVSEGEIDHVLTVLPADIGALLES